MLKGGVLKCEVQGSRVARVAETVSQSEMSSQTSATLGCISPYLTCTAVAPQSTLFDIVDGDTVNFAG